MDSISSLGSLGLGEASTVGSSGLGVDSTDLYPPVGGSSDHVETSPQLVHQSNRTAIYRLHDTGIKVILDRSPSDDQLIRQLLHEQNVSNFLPRSCRKRQVIDVTSFDRRPALSFKWVNGITLKEWLQKVQLGIQVDLNVRLRAAMAIAKTLSSFHEGGAVYNCLTPENIILAPFEGEYVATLIDLSSALVFRDGRKIDVDADFEKQLKGVDLRGLGLVLNQIFRGEESADTGSEEGAGPGSRCKDGNEDTKEDPDLNRRKRGKQQAVTDGLPLYLGSLISALLDTSASPEVCYESAKDVFLDLKIMAENANGCLRKCELDDSTIKSRLRLQGGMFYGRQVQMSMLLHLFQSSVVLGNQPMMATISGYPGTGKSTLVNQIKKPLTDLNGCFVEGKFDKNARPDSVLASALNTFFGNILETNGGNSLMPMKWRINDAIGSGGNSVLFEIVPNLQKWMADGNSATENHAQSSSGVKRIVSDHRLKFMFCKLIGAIASRAHPLVLFLDDLQWADEMTLDIIRMMMTDPDIQHFLFLGCYRDNEVNISHPLTDKLKAIQEQGISIVTIKIGPIEKECVNALLSEAMCMPPSLCRPLSNAVHSKTGGIILFVLRFLASLNDDKDLWFSMSARRWMYNLEEIRRKEIHGDVVSHMTERMKSLSKKMQMGLKFAACLGPNFSTMVLEKIQKDLEFEGSILNSCVDLGFLQKESSDQYVWAHDQIQQAAYDLIPLAKRESFHLLVGTRLFISTSPSELENMLFFIVDNMNRGSKLIDDQDQLYEISQLNLEAGEKALSSSAFHSAAKYLMTGLSLLRPESWELKYNLTIRLYDAASEALFVTGDFSRLSVLIEEPLINARSFEDKLNILNNLVRALAASAKIEEGMTNCFSILCQLGEEIPNESTPEIYAEEVSHVKQLLEGKSQQDLLSLPMMFETRKLAAMQFMNHALTMTFIAKPLLNPIIVLRMVKMSIEHGICNISAFGFACYGAWLVSEPSCDVEGGHRMGRVAIEMMKQLGAAEMTPRLYVTVYGFINIWKEPWQAGLERHLEAYKSGTTTGDMEYGITNLYQYANTALYCGENLPNLSQNLQSYAKRAFQCNQHNLWKSFVILNQLTLDLMGIKQNAFCPYSNGTTEESCFTSCFNNNNFSMCRLICGKKKFVAFFTGDLDAAAKMYEQSQKFPFGSTGRLVHILVSIFIDGLIGFFLARKHREDEKKWTNLGLDAIQSFRTWVPGSIWNFSNKLHLLEAEFYFLSEEDGRARACYQASIKAARDHRFIHEEGLAEEKLATYLLHKSQHDDALRHFINAKRCYDSWGACTLGRRVEKAIAILLPLCSGRG